MGEGGRGARSQVKTRANKPRSNLNLHLLISSLAAVL